MSTSPFLLPPEVDEISRLSDVTRWRLEKNGRFPKRIRIGGRKVAWRRADILEWCKSPEAWVKRHRPEGAVG